MHRAGRAYGWPVRGRLPALALATMVACSGSHPHLTRAQPTPATTAPAPSSPSTSTTAAVESAAAVAAELAAVEPAVRNPATPPKLLAEYGRRQLLAYRQLGRHPEWGGDVIRSDVIKRNPDLAEAITHNLAAQLELQALTAPRTDVPPWKVRPPKPAADLLAWYREAEASSGVPWAYLAAIHFVETHFGRVHGLSTAGAVGPMQFLPATWAAYGRGNIEDDHDAIQAAARYLRANGAPADLAAALFRYNRSVHYVRAITHYAQVLIDDPRAYAGYYSWPVLVRLTTGDVIIPEGNG